MHRKSNKCSNLIINLQMKFQGVTCVEIRKLEGKFYGIEYHHVVRDQNQLADHVSKIGSSRAVVSPRVFVQDLFVPSIKEEKEVQEIPPAEQLVLTVPSPTADWWEQFIKYLTSADVPADKTKTERLIHRSKHYVLVDGNLMRKSAKEGILQKCITQEDGVKLLLEIHQSAKLSELVFTGPRPSPMQKTSSDVVKDANFSPSRYTCRHKNYRPSQLPSLLHAGDWT